MPHALGPRNSCPACESEDAWEKFRGRKLVIGRQELDRVDEPERTFSPRTFLTLLPSFIALGAAVAGVVFAVALFRPVAIAPLEEIRAAIRGPAGSAALFGTAALILGVFGFIVLRRSRWFRVWPLTSVALLAVAAGLLTLPVGLYFHVSWSSPFGWKHLIVPPLGDPGIGPEAAVRVATAVVLAPDEDGDARFPAIGSGSVIRAEPNRAWILTCSHVAMPWAAVSSRRIPADAPHVWVYFSDGRNRSGRVVWIAPAPLDAAVVVVDIENPPPAIPARPDAGEVRMGEEIFFVANPLRAGWLTHRGEVIRREPKETPAGPYSLIYVDLPVQPGDSGTGLFLAAGQLIGLTTWRGEGSGGPVAIGLPSDAAHGILSVIEKPGALGVPDEEDSPR